MKMFNKTDCEYKNGYIVCGDEIMAIDNEVVDLFNKLENDIQKAAFEKRNCGPLPCYREPGQFVRETEHGYTLPEISVETPRIDKKIEEAQAIMEEIDAMNTADEINEYISGIKPVMLFVQDEFIVPCESESAHRFDLPTIGNPLELTKSELVEFVTGMFIDVDDTVSEE